MAPLGFLSIEASLSCGGCKVRLSIARLAHDLTCGACAATTKIDWTELLTVRHRGERVSVLDLLPACAEGDAFTEPDARIVVARPACSCGEPFADAALAAIHFKTKALTCGACGRETPARLVRDEVVPNARWALGEREGPALPVEGTVARCASCGAPARGAGAPERCAFCGATTIAPAGAPRTGGARVHVVLRGQPE